MLLLCRCMAPRAQDCAGKARANGLCDICGAVGTTHWLEHMRAAIAAIWRLAPKKRTQ
jgi:hypothetical protein